jgi:hypothetical protein
VSTIGAASAGCARKAILGMGLLVVVCLAVMIVVTPLLVLVGPTVGVAGLAGIAAVALAVRHWRSRPGQDQR